ncbi:hypothetical protein SB11R_14145 [Pseudomonas oryzihabitans]|nr:hypothetical protein SB11R_14145 [Pseudomonas psychrotolerans]
MAEFQCKPADHQSNDRQGHSAQQYGCRPSPEQIARAASMTNPPQQRQSQGHARRSPSQQPHLGHAPARRDPLVEQAELRKLQAGEVFRAKGIAQLVMQGAIERGQGHQDSQAQGLAAPRWPGQSTNSL